MNWSASSQAMRWKGNIPAEVVSWCLSEAAAQLGKVEDACGPVAYSHCRSRTQGDTSLLLPPPPPRHTNVCAAVAWLICRDGL